MSGLVSGGAEEVPAVELTGVSKRYATGMGGVRVQAVENLSLTIPRGCVLGLLGPNGSGKSTTIKLILGLARPDSGQVRILGEAAGSVAARARIGYLPESPWFPRHLTAEELLGQHAVLAGVPRERRREAIRVALERVGLGDAARRRLGTYSRGMLQRAGLAQAIVHEPDLVILDEPTAGLDPLGAERMAAVVAELRQAGCTVLLTSHLLGQTEDLCDRVAILHRGVLLRSGPVGQWSGAGARTLLETDGISAAQLEELRAWLAARGLQLHQAGAPPLRLDRWVREAVSAASGNSGGPP